MPWSVIWDSIWSTYWFSFSLTFGWDLDLGNDSSTRFSIQLPWEWVGARRESSFQGNFLSTSGSISLECQFLVINQSSENSKHKDNSGVSSANAFKSCSIFIVCYLQEFTVPLPLHTYSLEELPFEGSWLLLFVAFKMLYPDAGLLPDDMTHPLYAVLYTCIDTCCRRKSHSNSTLWKPFPLRFSLSQPFCSHMHIPEWPLNDL